MTAIGVVVNPHAGQNRRLQDCTAPLARALGADGHVRETGSLAEVTAAVSEFRERRIDILAICGGDGSFFRTLSATVRAYGSEPLPQFLPLRAGSMNTIARSVGCWRGSPERVLAHLVADCHAGRPLEFTERHLLCVNGEHFGFMVGAGVIVNFLRAYYGAKHSGPRGAAYTTLRVAGSVVSGSSLARALFREVEADVDCDGERLPHRRFNVMFASTINELGLGFQAAYLATRKRGFFHLLAGRVGATRLLRRLRRLRRGWPLEMPELYDNLAQRVRIQFRDPTPYMIDGDILGTVSSLDIATGPRLTIIRR